MEKCACCDEYKDVYTRTESGKPICKDCAEMLDRELPKW